MQKGRYEALCHKIGSDNILKVDSAGGVRFLAHLPITLLHTLRHAERIVFLPAQNGVRIIPLLLVWFNKFFHRKLYYIVIGGWLPVIAKQMPLLQHTLKLLDGIFVETSTMQKELIDLGVTHNVHIMPNFKHIAIRTQDEVIAQTFNPPYPICTFSRVTRGKGIEDAVKVVKHLNKQHIHPIYKLDIYGTIDKGEEEWFNNLRKQFTPEITYKGYVSANESVRVLSAYMLLLFPTHYYTEGIPGTIIDAYAAGVPVVSSMWQSYKDIIDENRTGYCYPFLESASLETILEDIAKVSPTELTAMRLLCLNKAHNYSPQAVITDFLSIINYTLK